MRHLDDTGTGLVFLGGTLKAVWKLLYTLGAGDIVVLSEQQFVLLAPGFLLIAFAIASFTLYRQSTRAA